MKILNLSSRAVLALVLAASLAVPAWPQTAATPAAYAIKGGKVFTLAGAPIENGTVIIRDGKIVAVGAKIAIPQDAQVIAATAVNPASAHIPVTRANGITEVIAAPGTTGFDLQSGGLIAGQASAFNLAGWTMDEMQINRSVAMVINWPTIQTSTFDFASFSVKEKPYADVKKEYDKSVNALSDWLDRARHYAQAKEKGSPALYERDLKLEALVPVVEGKLPVLVIADRERDIRNAVDFCTKQNLKMILGSGAEAWKVKELLKEKKIPVVLAPTNRLPEQEDTP